MKILSLLFCILPALLFSQNQRWYVNSAATGQNTGANWPNAFTNLHDAFIVAQDGDEVWVAQGVYHPSETGNRALRFEPLSGVRLYGGFTGIETQLTDRPVDGKSTIDGDIGVPGDSLDNSYNLMYLYHPDSTTLIDGFVFRNAVANNPAGTNGQIGLSGAALYIDGANSIAYPLIRNCAFENNTAQRDGGAVYINGAGTGSVSPGFEYCVFRANKSSNGQGGAVYKNGASWWDRPIDFLRCSFEKNKAVNGGCIYDFEQIRSDSLQITMCKFEQNIALIQGAILFCPSARATGVTAFTFISDTINNNINREYIALNNNISSGILNISMVSCIFNNILPINDGPFILAFSKDLTISNIDSCTISNTTLSFEFAALDDNKNKIKSISKFRNNNILKDNNLQCNYRNFNQKLIISNNKLQNSSFFFDSNFLNNDVKIDNIVENNLITNSLFELVFDSALISNNCFNNSNLRFRFRLLSKLINNTFTQDTFLNSNIILKSKMQINNSIMFNIFRPTLGGFNSNNFFYYLSDSIFLSNCLFSDSIDVTKIYYDSTTLFQTNPLFRNPAAQDYRLSACSPAINAGNNAIVNSIGLLTDLNGDPRIQEGVVDIGAYEHTFVPGPQTLQVDAVCHPNDQGAINWTLGGGCAPIQYTWTDAQGNSGVRLDSLPAGEYRFTFTDARSRVNEQTILIPASAPTVSISGDTLLCGAGSTGALTALPGGVLQTPITFMWNTGASGPGISGLSTGLYAVTLTDAVGCADTAQTNLNVVNAPQSSSSVTNATGVDSLNGRIDFAVTSGVGPYTYNWDTGDSTASLSDLAPGIYTMLLTDGAGCTYGYVFEVGVTIGTSAPGVWTGRVWPNPAQDILYLDLPTQEHIASLQLTDALGRVVYSSDQMTPSISVAHLPEGVYYLMIRQARGAVFSEKVVVRR
jgi:hypothetical protein